MGLVLRMKWPGEVGNWGASQAISCSGGAFGVSVDPEGEVGDVAGGGGLGDAWLRGSGSERW